MIRLIFLIFVINLIFVSAFRCFSNPEMPLSMGDETSRGEKLFKANCSGCHLGGQNLIKPDKPLAGSLKLKSKQSLKAFIENPPPPMPKFKNIADKADQLDALYNYVVSLMGK